MVQNMKNGIIHGAKHEKRYYAWCKILKTVLCMVQNIKNGIMHGAKC